MPKTSFFPYFAVRSLRQSLNNSSRFTVHNDLLNATYKCTRSNFDKLRLSSHGQRIRRASTCVSNIRVKNSNLGIQHQLNVITIKSLISDTSRDATIYSFANLLAITLVHVRTIFSHFTYILVGTYSTSIYSICI